MVGDHSPQPSSDPADQAATAPVPVPPDPGGTAASQSPVAPPAGQDADAVRLAAWSYREVLDATKHQDDKAGRLLAGVAFLFTGAAALLSLSRAGEVRVELDGRVVPLVAWYATAGLVLLLAAAALLVLSVATPLTPPRTPPPADGPQPSPGTPPRSQEASSYLFFSQIAKVDEGAFRAQWEEDHRNGRLPQRLADQLVAEAWNLSRRVQSKYHRAEEGAALLLAGLSLIAASLALGLVDLPPADGPLTALPFDVGRRLALGFVLGLLPALQVWSVAGSALNSAHTKAPRRRAAWLQAAAGLLVAYPTLVLSAPEDGRVRWGVLLGAAVLGGAMLFVVWMGGGPAGKRGTWWCFPAGVGAAGGPLLASLVPYRPQLDQALVATVPVVVLLVLQVGRSQRDLRGERAKFAAERTESGEAKGSRGGGSPG